MTLAETQGSDARDLALLNEELGLLIDGATNHAIYMRDPGGHVTIWKRGAERIKGRTQAEILGRHFGLFYPPVARWDVAQQAEPLNALVREAASLGLIGADQAGVETVMTCAADSECAHVDRVQIQQVLVNLIRNALQAMADSPRRRLTITTALVSKDLLEVTVADTGGGIAPEMGDRLFRAFASTKQDGMGLGLSICQTIVEAHGGHIGADPVMGGGTAFHFTLMRSMPHAG